LPGPIQLPAGVRSQKIVLRDTLLEGVLQDQTKEQVRRRKARVSRVVS
jgi:hypothetical protein